MTNSTMKFAFRNLLRNRRRSLFTLASIAVGFAAVTLFAGYTQVVYRGLQDQAIYGELLGHLTLGKKVKTVDGHFNPQKILFNQEEIAKIKSVVHGWRPEMQVVQRLHVSGMLSNGRASSIFIAEAVEPQDMQILRGPRSGMSGTLDTGNADQVTVSKGLAEMLGLKEGDTAAVLSNTLSGQTNALDVQINDVFSTGNAGTEDKFMYFPLRHAQLLVDAPGMADKLTLYQKEGMPTHADIAMISHLFEQAGLNVELHGWQELSVFYRQVKSMFDLIFGFLLMVVLVIVVLSVSSAMNMSVVERTREIGTLRAIGMRQGGINRQFAMEALLLVLGGCVFGLLLAVAVRYGINAADFSYQPPNASDSVPLLIGMDREKTILVAIMLVLLSVISAYFPARRAACQPLVDTLTHT